jgi:DNA polymerase I
MSERVLLLDGHSLAYRAFYALPVENFTTTTGHPTNAVYGFTSMLINVLRDERPTAVAVAFDVSRKTFRTERFPDYKATRSSSPEEFKGQVSLIKELLLALNIQAIEAEGYEADDIIATLTRQARERGDDVAIVTGDRDAFQLVAPGVTVLYPRKGVSDLARMTPEAIEEKYGLRPDQYPDYAALRGDPSDNLPGIPGVGEKTAGKWIREYGSLAGLVDNVDTVPGKAGEALRAALPQVLINRDLTQLLDDVPIGVSTTDCMFSGWEQAPVDELFDTLQFRALRDRLIAQNPKAVVEAEVHSPPQPTVDAEVVATSDVAAWLKDVVSPAAIAFAGTWGKGTGVIERIAVADGAGRVGVLPWGPEAAVWLLDPNTAKHGHDVKGPLLAVLSEPSSHVDDPPSFALDTAIAAYVCAPGERSYSLNDVSERILGRSVTAAAEQDQVLFGAEDDGSSLAAEASAIADLATALEVRVDAQGSAPLLLDVEMPLIGVLAKMEHAGIAIDVPGLQALSDEFGADMRRAEESAHEIAGRPFNLGSPKQLQEVLFVDRGLPKTKKIKTGFTTDAESLQWLFETTGDPLCEQLLAWRDRSRLRQTVEGLIPLADSSGRVHTTFNQTVAATGRLSSTDPNLQNIPIRTEAGRRIRDCFVVGEGYATLLTADYSQIEMRIMAHASQDEGLIRAFHSGEDLHTTVGSQVFGVPATEVTPEMRRRIKAMSYGLAYGLSAFGLAQQLGISPDEARSLMNTYFERFGGVRDYLADVVVDARQHGYTETMFGRRRFLPDLTSENRQRREMAERMALNAPIQGTAADIVKIAMLRVDAALTQSGLRTRLLLQVHDELVLEVPAGEEQEAEGLVRQAMEGAADLLVPLDVSVGSGRSWDAAAH